MAKSNPGYYLFTRHIQLNSLYISDDNSSVADRVLISVKLVRRKVRSKVKSNIGPKNSMCNGYRGVPSPIIYLV